MAVGFFIMRTLTISCMQANSEGIRQILAITIEHKSREKIGYQNKPLSQVSKMNFEIKELWFWGATFLSLVIPYLKIFKDHKFKWSRDGLSSKPGVVTRIYVLYKLWSMVPSKVKINTSKKMNVTRHIFTKENNFGTLITCTCSKPTIARLQKGAKYVQS